MKWQIFIGSREMAREMGDPCLGTVEAGSKEEAEKLAAKDGEIASRAYPGGGLWAVKIQNDTQEQQEEKSR